jgi:hypothetical protein
MEVTQIVVLLTPVIVWVVTAVVKLVSDKISGAWIVAIVVPVVSILVALVSGVVFPEGSNFWLQVGVGLVAVFLNELKNQLSKPKTV